MPTQEIPDDELDDLFRKASGEHAEEFDPEAWRRMEKLLDQEGGRGLAFPWRKGLWMLLGLLLLGTLGIWYANRTVLGEGGKAAEKERKRATNPQLAQSKRVVTGEEQTAYPAEGFSEMQKKESKPEKENHLGQLANQNGNPAISENGAGRSRDTYSERMSNKPARERSKTSVTSTPLPQPAKAKRKSTPGAKPEVSTSIPGGLLTEKTRQKQPSGERHPSVRKRNQGRNLLSGQGPKRFREQEINPDPVISLQQPGPDPVQGNRNNSTENSLGTQEEGEEVVETMAVENAGALRDNEASYNPLTGKSIVIEPPQLKAGEVPAPAVKPYFIERPPVEKPYRLSVALMLSPDLSSVGFFNAAVPGTNAGVRLEYRLSNRSSVNAGLVHSVKNYSAKPEDYHPPYGTWGYGRKPSAIDAKCKVLDIPLNLRFDAIRQPKYTLFVSNGLSSYIMLSERYNYTYDVPNSYLIQRWTGRRTGNFYFSVYNVSMGYERQFNKRFSWQVEPFLKLPLGGVGFGKVRLLSTGVFFTAKYHLLR